MKITTPLNQVCLFVIGFVMAVPLVSNASLLFDGSDSKATMDGSYLGATNTYYVTNYTLEVWIKPYSLQIAGELFGKINYWDEWDLTVLPDGGLIFGGAWSNYYWGTETAPGSIATNVWQHVCCAVTNGEASFYVNGNLVGTETVQNPIDFYAATNVAWAIPPYSFDGRMPIGYTDSGTTPDYNFFSGLIYGIRVWNRTLSACEVQAIATTGVPRSTNGLYNAVMLNEDSGTTIHDSLTSLTGRVLTAQWSGDSPTFVNLLKAVKPEFNNLATGTNYQLQVSSDLLNWTNQGAPFTATNGSMIFPQYFDVANWNQLFFRLQKTP